MLRLRTWVIRISTVLMLSAGFAVQAIPVTDAGAIAQLIQQISYWKQQIDAMSNQLIQLKASHDAMTGGRGMEQLLSGTMRNYLPADWAALSNTLQGLSGTYSVLAARLGSTINQNAAISPQKLASLSQAAQQQIQRDRQLAAMNQVLAREALSNTSTRFASVQQLIDTIPRATDQKAVLDLQARIAAEQAMLQNEQTKLQMLNQAMDAEEKSRKQRIREQAVAGIGSLRALEPLRLP